MDSLLFSQMSLKGLHSLSCPQSIARRANVTLEVSKICSKHSFQTEWTLYSDPLKDSFGESKIPAREVGVRDCAPLFYNDHK